MASLRYDILSEQIKRILSGGDSSEDSELDLREIRLLVGQVHASLIKISYFDGIKAEGQHGINGQFKTTFYKLPVLTNTDRGGENYVVLPEQCLSLPHGKGLDSGTEWNKPHGKSFIPVSTGFAAMSRGTRYGALEGQFGMYQEGMNVYFVNQTESDFKVPFVNIRIAHGSGDTVSADQELAIIGEVTRLLSARKGQDKQNDGNPTAV